MIPIPPFQDGLDNIAKDQVKVRKPSWVMWFQSIVNMLGIPPNYTSFEQDGTLVMNGNATVWNDINFPLSSAKPGATAPTWTTIVGGIKGWVFAHGLSTAELQSCSEIMHDYKQGTSLSVHIHWSPMTTDTGNVRWGLEYAYANVGGVRTASTTIYAAAASPGVVGTHVKTTFPLIVDSSILIGANICLRLFRDGADVSDTFPGGAFTPNLGIHYECDTIGSRQITAK